MIEPINDPTDLQLAVMLGRIHRSTPFLFWRSPDWGNTHVVELERKDPENMIVRTRIIGRGILLPPGEQHGIS